MQNWPTQIFRSFMAFNHAALDIKRTDFINEEDYAQASIIVGILVVFLLAWIGHVPLYFWVLDLPSAAWLTILLGIPTTIAGILVIKLRQNFTLGAILAHFGGLFTLISVALPMGGIFGPAIIWILFGCVSLFLCSGRLAGITIVIVALAGIIGLGILNQTNIIKGPNLESSTFVFFSISTMCGALIALGVITSIFNSRIRRSLIQAECARAKEKEKNRDLKAVLSHTSVGILSIKADGLIHEDYSESLTSILEEKELAGKCAIEMIFRHSDVSTDQISQMKSIITSSLDESHLNFEVNAHCLVRNMKFQGRDNEKVIEIDWAPILNSSNNIEKILVSIKDATEHSLLRAKHADAEELLDYIRELIEIEPARFMLCYQDNQKMIEDSIKTLGLEENQAKKYLKEVYTNMHTIKGNSRNFNLSRVVHQATIIENRYSQLLQGKANNMWNLPAMITELKELERINSKYYTIALEKMGWSNDSDSIRISKRALQAEIDKLGTKELNELPEPFRDPIRNVLRLVHVNRNDSLHSLVDDLKLISVKLAKDLHKASPVIVAKGSDFILKKQGHEVLRKSFIHIVRNALDHGIEPVDDRLARNKSPEGHINIEASQRDGYLSIVIRDDGRGLNIARLRNLGEKLGVLTQNASNTAVAQVIFEDGISTAKELSDISGRGVGMAAVKRFLEQINGEVRIHVKADSPHLNFVPIEIELLLPDQYFCIAPSLFQQLSS